MTAFEAPALELLFERPGLQSFGLPHALVEIYGGVLGFGDPCLFANFVASVDGVVALPVAEESGHVVSRGSEADRFVMGLLRACADVVLIGAGTFRKTPGELWHAETIYPPGAALFAEVRERLGLSARPTLVLVTASGAIDPKAPALEDSLIVTTAGGEAALRRSAPEAPHVLVLGTEKIELKALVATLHAQGSRRILSEGGPSLLANLIAENLLDELFLTVSPLLFGRYPGDRRKTLADGIDLAGVPLELLSARRDGSHLFLRYALSGRSSVA